MTKGYARSHKLGPSGAAGPCSAAANRARVRVNDKA